MTRRRDEYENWFLGRMTSLRFWLAVLVLVLGLGFVSALLSPERADGAAWVRLRWTNPEQLVDSLQLLQVRAPRDTIARALYASPGGASKRPGIPAALDSGYVSVSTANLVSGGTRLLLRTRNGRGWSEPSNAVTVFYAARDTVYHGPVHAGAYGATRAWLGPGVLAVAQTLGDTAWVAWEHQEMTQQRWRSRLCALFGYWALRGARQVCP